MRSIRWCVLHSAESQELAGAAVNIAGWFAKEDTQASAHYVVDSSQIIACVREKDIAWAAPGANQNGVHVELAGKAAQTSDQWFDDYSTRVLDLASGLVADICRRNRIPLNIVGPAGLLMNLPGITTHMAVSQAFKKSDHSDPGEGFPLNAFIEMVLRKAA